MLAQVEINDLKNTKLQEIEDMRMLMVKITNEAALTVLGLKNDLAKLERSYNQSRALGLKWEKTLNACKDAVSINELDKERALDSIQILYRMLCRRRGEFRYRLSRHLSITLRTSFIAQASTPTLIVVMRKGRSISSSVSMSC